MLKARVTSEAGFTLVEGLVAGLILVIGILGSVGIFDSSRRESGTGERLQVAQAKAEAELERMRDVPYAELATNSGESWTPSGHDGDPSGRVISGSTPQFKVSDSSSEALVRTSSGGIKPYSPPATVTIGGSDYSMSVYRFVTWRDVECRIADLSPLKSRLNLLLGPLSTRLTNIVGTGGRLDKILAIPLARLPAAVRSRFTSAQTISNNLKTQVLALISAINALNEVDPCDADISSLKSIDSTVSALQPTLDSLDTALGSYYQPGCLSLLNIPLVCPGVGTSAYNAVNTQIQALESHNYVADLQSIVTSVGQINSSNHTHNTKRVTVAIVLDPVSGSGPFQPVWATSVVSDPNAGLLSG
jgi:Tfp pilus assembly protein PilV